MRLVNISYVLNMTMTVQSSNQIITVKLWKYNNIPCLAEIMSINMPGLLA